MLQPSDFEMLKMLISLIIEQVITGVSATTEAWKIQALYHSGWLDTTIHITAQAYTVLSENGFLVMFDQWADDLQQAESILRAREMLVRPGTGSLATQQGKDLANSIYDHVEDLLKDIRSPDIARIALDGQGLEGWCRDNGVYDLALKGRSLRDNIETLVTFTGEIHDVTLYINEPLKAEKHFETFWKENGIDPDDAERQHRYEEDAEEPVRVLGWY